jgi:hypothetical protein
MTALPRFLQIVPAATKRVLTNKRTGDNILTFAAKRRKRAGKRCMPVLSGSSKLWTIVL